MVKVTDKDYYMQHNTKELLDFFIKRHKKKWDNIILIDGVVGAGKSTLAQLIGYYYAYTSKIPFTVDNIFFDPEKMIDFATSTKNQVIIWDEAALGALNTQGRNKLSTKLVQALMTARSRGHLWIFCVPSFFKLIEYIAIDRSVCLFHCYSPDMLSRGFYTVYNYRQKEYMYEKRYQKKFYGKGSFPGQWVKKNCNVIPEEEYEAKKDEAINLFFKQQKSDKKDKYAKMLERLAGIMTVEQWKHMTGLSDRSFRRYNAQSEEVEA